MITFQDIDDDDDFLFDHEYVAVDKDYYSIRIFDKPSCNSPRILGPYVLPKYRYQVHVGWDIDKNKSTVNFPADNNSMWGPRKVYPNINLTHKIFACFPNNNPYDMDENVENYNEEHESFWKDNEYETDLTTAIKG